LELIWNLVFEICDLFVIWFLEFICILELGSWSLNKLVNILWFTWKDRKNPLAGGAEVVSGELAKRLAKRGHKVIILTAGFAGAKHEEKTGGYRVVRVGNRWSVYLAAFIYYKRHLQGWADIVIDEINTIPFFAKYFVKEKNILVCYQLCREIWFHQMFFPLNLLGYVIEPFYLWLLKDRTVITESRSTKLDLIKHGFSKTKIQVISVGTEFPRAKKINIKGKFKNPTLLYLGTLRSMKRPDQTIKAFEIAKNKIPALQLVIAGQGKGLYSRFVNFMVKNSAFADSISLLGRISNKKKVTILRESHLLLATSVKEGWGLTVTEAASQGTPAVVYDVDGLRDAVLHNKTGLVCRKSNPNTMAENIVKILKDKKLYNRLRKNAWKESKNVNFGRSCKEFMRIIKLIS